jgi:hypothetical protein
MSPPSSGSNKPRKRQNEAYLLHATQIVEGSYYLHPPVLPTSLVKYNRVLVFCLAPRRHSRDIVKTILTFALGGEGPSSSRIKRMTSGETAQPYAFV